MECEQLPNPQSWDEAGPDKIKEFRSHIQFCSSCRARVLAEAPDQLLFDLSIPSLPQDFWFGFWNSLQHKHVTSFSPSRRLPPVRWAAVFVIGISVLLYGPERNRTELVPVARVEVKTTEKELESYPVIENIQNPDARYYIFQSGKEEKIVMVFDPSMEL